MKLLKIELVLRIKSGTWCLEYNIFWNYMCRNMTIWCSKNCILKHHKASFSANNCPKIATNFVTPSETTDAKLPQMTLN